MNFTVILNVVKDLKTIHKRFFALLRMTENGQIKIFLLVCVAVLMGAGCARRSYDIVSSPHMTLPPQVEAPILVTTPKSNAYVTSPLVVEGKARGDWYFEASFPVRLLDDAGKELATAPAQAKGEWMTTNFVPFSATLSFDPGKAQRGTLVLEKDNPSGLPQNDASIRIPVRFDDPYRWVKVYFTSSKKDPQALHCDTVYPVLRNVPKEVKAVARAALGELIGGPDEVELSQGYDTALPSDVVIKRLVIRDGVASVDFNDALERGVGGSCRVQTIRAQIEKTLLQFSTVKRVVISVNGNTEDILQP